MRFAKFVVYVTGSCHLFVCVCNLYFYNPLNFLQDAPYKHLGAFYMYVCTDGTTGTCTVYL